MTQRTLLTAALFTLFTGAAHAQKHTLSVGGAAPGLDIEKWVKGTETTLAEGNVYVVEFWATWCAPCKKSIPHLNQLQKDFADKGLTIIGISNEEPAVVERFVKAQGSKMDYTVAVDRRDSTSRAWMKAAGLEGIPSAFVVDRKGRIAFIGHPLDDAFELTLERVITGRFDPKLEKQAAPLLAAARSARTVRNWRLASKHYDDVIALDSQVFAAIALERFEMMLVDMDDSAQAYTFARETLIGKHFASDAEALRMLAAKIVLDPKIDKAKRDLDLALEAADASCTVAGSRNADALATSAMVRFHRGEIDEAVNLQKQAYFNAAPRFKPEFRRTLATYQEAVERSYKSARNPS